MLDVPLGTRARQEHTVAATDTAEHWGNHIPVLATPVLLWLGETTAMLAVAGYLEDDEMTVGVGHDALHLAPTPVGHRVTITATLVQHQGRQLVFEVEGRDEHELVLKGTHTRAVVGKTRFLARIADKARG